MTCFRRMGILWVLQELIIWKPLLFKAEFKSIPLWTFIKYETVQNSSTKENQTENTFSIT